MCNTMVDCAKLYSVLAGPDFENQIEKTWFQPKIQIPKLNPVNSLSMKFSTTIIMNPSLKLSTVSRSNIEKVQFLI